jgi:D-sedoheptulose 7-phosphate isomerase
VVISPTDMVSEYFHHYAMHADAAPTAGLLRMADVLWQACVSGGTVYVFGNGACAALAAHMATDLSKGTAVDVGVSAHPSAPPRLRVVSLSENTALLTAYGNDVGYEWVFAEQLRTLLRPGDVVLAASGSGGSPNVLRALEWAATVGVTRLGLTGQQPTAGELVSRCELAVQAPSDRIEQIEDWHVIYQHVLTVVLRARLRAYSESLLTTG